METGAESSSPSLAETSRPRKVGKRDRVVLACQRCQRRKQKCDGSKPSCASCAKHSLQCTYVPPSTPAAGERKQYISALERRVADLEHQLSAVGQQPPPNDGPHSHRQTASSTATPSLSLPPPLPTQPSTTGSFDGPAEPRRPDDENGNEIMSAVRDISLSASGNYVGGGNINIGRVLSSLASNETPASASPRPGRKENPRSPDDDDPAPRSIRTMDPENVGVPRMSPQVSERLMTGWHQHIATRYPMLHTPKVHWLYTNQDRLVDVYDKSMLHLVYAVSGRWLESAGDMGYFFSDQHYELALANMDHIGRLQNERTVDFLLLLTLYCTRAPRDPGAWTYVGVAMRLCIELGMHRAQRHIPPSMEKEMKKRRFWTAYFLDRDISIAIGRPPGISDRDIDAEYPLDIDESINDDEAVRQVSQQPLDQPRSPPTTLTPFIHRLRLKRIESEIQHDIYRVDTSARPPDPLIESYLARLDAWNRAIPAEATQYQHRPEPGQPYDGAEFFTIHYHRCVRFLLYPQLYRLPVNIPHLRRCADACAGVINDYRNLHLKFPLGFSALSIQSVFLSGLTLIYCAWLIPGGLVPDVDRLLADAQLLLYIICERYPSARRYRDVFERVKNTISTEIANGANQAAQSSLKQHPHSQTPGHQHTHPHSHSHIHTYPHSHHPTPNAAPLTLPPPTPSASAPTSGPADPNLPGPSPGPGPGSLSASGLSGSHSLSGSFSGPSGHSAGLGAEGGAFMDPSAAWPSVFGDDLTAMINEMTGHGSFVPGLGFPGLVPVGGGPGVGGTGVGGFGGQGFGVGGQGVGGQGVVGGQGLGQINGGQGQGQGQHMGGQGMGVLPMW